MSTELATIEHSQTASEIRSQVNRIQEVMKAVMIKGTHYGVVPGCGDKPTLLKPGAEKLMMTFRLAVDPEVEDLSDTYTRRYRVKTRFTSQSTGLFLGTGVGECASDEEKYAWREAVCREEYDAADPALRREKWKRNQKSPVLQVHTNPSDVANTILKMAKKRSLVDGVLTVTAASDIFTQDLEEMPEELHGNGQATQPKVADPVVHEMRVPNYGPDAGQPFSQVKTEHLENYLVSAERSITDPKRVNFLEKNREMRDALIAEIAKREQATIPTTASTLPVTEQLDSVEQHTQPESAQETLQQPQKRSEQANQGNLQADTSLEPVIGSTTQTSSTVQTPGDIEAIKNQIATAEFSLKSTDAGKKKWQAILGVMKIRLSGKQQPLDVLPNEQLNFYLAQLQRAQAAIAGEKK